MASVLCPPQTIPPTYPLTHPHPPEVASSSSSSSKRSVSFTPPVSPMYAAFALARVKGSIHLVQVQPVDSTNTSPSSSCAAATSPTPSTSLLDVKVFRHEFITISRLSHCERLGPSEIRILELIDDRLTRYEEENDTVFLAKELTERLHQMTTIRAQSRARTMMLPHPGAGAMSSGPFPGSMSPRRRLQPSHR